MGTTTSPTEFTNNDTNTKANSVEELAVWWHLCHWLWQREPPKRCCWTPWMISLLCLWFILFKSLIYCFCDDPCEQIKKFVFTSLLTRSQRLWSKLRGSTQLVLKVKVGFVCVAGRSSKFPLCSENRGGEGTKKWVRFFMPSSSLFSTHKGSWVTILSLRSTWERQEHETNLFFWNKCNSKASGWWRDQKMWNFKFHYFWSHHQRVALLFWSWTMIHTSK